MRARNKKILIKSVFLTFLVLPGLCLAEKPYSVVGTKADIYFGHISYVEIKNDGRDPVIIRESTAVPEPALLNSPVGPGDLIRTSDARRCEVQFDTGTIVRLDTSTELKVETVMAQTLTSPSKATNLALHKGCLYIQYKEYNRRELFQVMTDNAAVKLDHFAVATLIATGDGVTDLQVKYGRAAVLFGPSAQNVQERKVKKNERFLVFPDNQAQPAEFVSESDFDLWNKRMNDEFLALHKGQSALPKPVMRYSPAIIAWAQKYSSLYGEWLWDSLYGYVWRPYTSDRYPSGTWQPYIYGQWTMAHGQMYWVPQELWGWIPYHLGTWMWDKKLGWFWLPGSAFAPAWSVWEFYAGYYMWKPWSFLDWWYYKYYLVYTNSRYWVYPYYWWNYTWVSSKPRYNDDISDNISLKKITKKQLEEATWLRPLPKELKPVYQKVLKAINNKDPRLMASLQETSRQFVCLRPADIHLSRIQDKALRLEQIPATAEPPSRLESVLNTVRGRNPSAEACMDFQRNVKGADAARQTVTSFWASPSSSAGLQTLGSVESSLQPPAPMPTRFRDWNPDMKAALKEGVSIRYFSRGNEVQCPELGLTSRNVSIRRTEWTSSFGFSSSSGHSTAGSPSGTSGSNSSSSRSSSSESGSSSQSKSGGHDPVKRD